MITRKHLPRAMVTLAIASVLSGSAPLNAPTRSLPSTLAEGAAHEPLVSAGQVRVSQVSAGVEHTCALTDNGQAFCWGEASFDRLGTDPPSTLDQPKPVPVAMPQGVRFTAISAGLYHTCAITAGGQAYCWGSNNSGELGVLSSKQRNLPTQVYAPGGIRFTAIAAGPAYTCALASNQKAYCWGSDRASQLGNGLRGGEPVPFEVAMPPGVSLTRIATGRISTCALGANGRAYCWGANRAQGLLGDGLRMTRERGSPIPVEVQLPRRSRATAVAVGEFHACALVEDGGAYCWGDDEAGQLGNGPDTGSIQPVPVAVALPVDVTLVSITLGSGHSCALDTVGRAFCWGGYGQHFHTAPVKVRAPREVRFTQIEAGRQHTCAVGTDARAYCWGVGGHGRLGDGHPDRYAPAPVTVILPGAD